jgi:hypothetical protein
MFGGSITTRGVHAAAVGLLPARAHHSFAMFDQQRQLTLHGVVKEFRWTNPHAFVQLLVAAEDGTNEEWSIEMTSPEHLLRAGWKPRMLQAGDQIVVTVHPLRDGPRGGQYMSGSRADGTPLGRGANANHGTTGGSAK